MNKINKPNVFQRRIIRSWLKNVHGTTSTEGWRKKLIEGSSVFKALVSLNGVADNAQPMVVIDTMKEALVSPKLIKVAVPQFKFVIHKCPECDTDKCIKIEHNIKPSFYIKPREDDPMYRINKKVVVALREFHDEIPK